MSSSGRGPSETSDSGADILDRKLDTVASSLRESTPIPVKVAAALRSLILSGQLKPGDRIVEFKIARQLGIGQPTAREALLLLETEGLVQRSPNRGCSVTSLTIKQIDQIYCVRVELEPLAAELAVDNATNWDRRLLEDATRRLRESATSGSIELWHQRDLEFHQTLWKLADNPFLEKALSQTSIPFFAFAELVFLQTQPRDLVQQAERHEVFVEAILSGDRKEARRLTRKVLMDFWEDWRELARIADKG